MPSRRPLQDRLDELARRRAQVDAEIAALSARARQDAKKDEDRIKFLLGTLVWERMAEDPSLRAFVERELPARLTARDRDRGLWERLFPQEADEADEADGADGAVAAHGTDGSEGGAAMASADAPDHALSPRAEG